MVIFIEKIYRSYYTKSDPILEYMVQKLDIKSNDKVLEPCAGDGVFIDVIVNKNSNVDIDAFEINPEAYNILLEKHGHNKNITLHLSDILVDPVLLQSFNSEGLYNKIIGNPPYGGWIDYKMRKELKKIYPDLYVKETYSLFLYKCLASLKNHGILVFIVPDTFLNLHRHKFLREYILSSSKIREICLFPSSFFPGVNFGYSKLCIITLERCNDLNECMNNRIKIISRLRTVRDLNKTGKAETQEIETYLIKQHEVYANPDHALFISNDQKILELIANSKYRIADIADCVTGFYSGNDKNYLRHNFGIHRNIKKYNQLKENEKYYGNLSVDQQKYGINSENHFVPIVKGGGVRFLKPDNWFMDWSVDAVKNYKVDKKARYQNPQFYFKLGIGVPMVSSKKITAALIEERLFDQSIVGIFPYDLKYLNYLLAFFNSDLCNQLIRTINPSANNSANYIKKIPFVYPNEKELNEINTVVSKIIEQLKNGETCSETYLKSMNQIFEKIFFKE